MTQREIIYDIRERLKFSSDDDDFTDSYLAHLINVKRAFLVKQRFSKFTKNIPEEVKQIICIDLSPVDVIDGAPCFGDVLRSDEPIPSLMEIGGRSAIVGIRVQDILHPHINIVPTERLPFTGYNKFLAKQIYAALDADNYLYFKSSNILHFNLEKVKVIGVFSDVEKADELNCTSSEECDFLDKEYPIESYLLNDLINLIMQELAPTLKIQEDQVNDAEEKP